MIEYLQRWQETETYREEQSSSQESSEEVFVKKDLAQRAKVQELRTVLLSEKRWCYDMRYNMYNINYDISSDYAQMLD